MATLYIEEYADLQEDVTGTTMQSLGGPVAKQKVSIGAASAQSVAFNSRTEFLLITSDVDCQFEIDDDPTADGDSRFLPAALLRSASTENKTKIAVIEKQ